MLIRATNDHKPSMAVSDPAPGGAIPLDGELVVWVGTGLAGSDAQAVAGLQRCIEAIQEAGSPNTGISAKLTTQLDGSGKSNVVIGLPSSTPASNGVMVSYGATFQADEDANVIWKDVAKRAIEKFLEARKDH
jgi:hypothetical protein